MDSRNVNLLFVMEMMMNLVAICGGSGDQPHLSREDATMPPTPPPTPAAYLYSNVLLCFCSEHKSLTYLMDVSVTCVTMYE